MNNKFSKIVSERLRTSLKESKVSQTELAQMIHKSRAYVSNITKGRYMPKISELVKISSYLKKPIGYFLGEDSPGLMHYVTKAKKWDKLLSLIEKDIRQDFKDDVVAIPLLDNTQLRNKNIKELYELKNNTNSFIYLSRGFIKNIYKFQESFENLVAVSVFTRDYPEFGIQLGDISVYVPIQNNDIGDYSGKLFGVLYKGNVGIKRIYKEANKFYFEPMHSPPQIEKIPKDDPDLVIAGRLVFNINTKFF